MNGRNRTAPVIALLTGISISSALCDGRCTRKSTATSNLIVVSCEESATDKSNGKIQVKKISDPSWIRRQLYSWKIIPSLPIPRVLHQFDPDLTLAYKQQSQRERDENRVRQLQQELQLSINKSDKKSIGETLKEIYEILYGKDVLPQDRQDFLMRYGCTGFTNEILDRLVEIGQNRGIVEIGAGNGQWARALHDRYQNTTLNTKHKKSFDFIMAFDNMSQLPLNPKIYHKKTQPHHDFFYEKVQKCDTELSVLKHFVCRGRILLLVYPSPGDMAHQAIQTYAETSDRNDTVVYVGEGRGGANANDAFFDYLESGDWVLLETHAVLPFGDKGYEKAFIFVKRCK